MSQRHFRWPPLLGTVALATFFWSVTFHIFWGIFWFKISFSAAALAGLSPTKPYASFRWMARVVVGYRRLCRSPPVVIQLHACRCRRGSRCLLGGHVLARAKSGSGNNLPFDLEHGCFRRVSDVVKPDFG